MMYSNIKLLVAAIFFVGQSCVQHRMGMDRGGHNYNTRNKNVVPTTQDGKINKYEDIKNDWLFKHVFGEFIPDPNNNDNENPYTLKLLNTLLELEGDEEIKYIEFLKETLSADRNEEHAFITDVHCTQKNKKRFIIEMQLAHHSGWENRIQAYVGRDFGSQLKKSEDYDKDILPVHLLAITNFNMFGPEEEYLSHHTTRSTKTNNHTLKGMAWTIFELPKFNDKVNKANNWKEAWGHFFKNSQKINTWTDEQRKEIIPGPLMEQAYERINRANWHEDERIAYDRAEDKRKVAAAVRKKDREEGREEGEAKANERNEQNELDSIDELLDAKVPDGTILNSLKRKYPEEKANEIFESPKRARG